jgi:hypothetical protein
VVADELVTGVVVADELVFGVVDAVVLDFEVGVEEPGFAPEFSSEEGRSSAEGLPAACCELHGDWTPTA